VRSLTTVTPGVSIVLPMSGAIGLRDLPKCDMVEIAHITDCLLLSKNDNAADAEWIPQPFAHRCFKF
jgi:hypothetical protein